MKVVEFWCNAKIQRTQNKKKQKKNKHRSGTKNKRVCFDRDALSSSDSGDSFLSSTSSSADDEEEETTKDSSFLHNQF